MVGVLWSMSVAQIMYHSVTDSGEASSWSFLPSCCSSRCSLHIRHTMVLVIAIDSNNLKDSQGRGR